MEDRVLVQIQLGVLYFSVFNLDSISRSFDLNHSCRNPFEIFLKKINVQSSACNHNLFPIFFFFLRFIPLTQNIFQCCNQHQSGLIQLMNLIDHKRFKAIKEFIPPINKLIQKFMLEKNYLKKKLLQSYKQLLCARSFPTSDQQYIQSCL